MRGVAVSKASVHEVVLMATAVVRASLPEEDVLWDHS